MEKNLDNRQATPKKRSHKKKSAGKKAPSKKPADSPAEKKPSASAVGRPPAADRKKETERVIVHNDGKNILEQCTLCGRTVKMEVYATKGVTRYCRCPACQRRLALRGNTARAL